MAGLEREGRASVCATGGRYADLSRGGKILLGISSIECIGFFCRSRVFAHTFPPAQVWLEGCSLLFPRVLWVSSIAIKRQAARELRDPIRSDSRRAQHGSRGAEVSFGSVQCNQSRIKTIGQGQQSTHLSIDPVCLQAQAQPATTRPLALRRASPVSFRVCRFVCAADLTRIDTGVLELELEQRSVVAEFSGYCRPLQMPPESSESVRDFREPGGLRAKRAFASL